jgi:hypothetical protein
MKKTISHFILNVIISVYICHSFNTNAQEIIKIYASNVPEYGLFSLNGETKSYEKFRIDWAAAQGFNAYLCWADWSDISNYDNQWNITPLLDILNYAKSKGMKVAVEIQCSRTIDSRNGSTQGGHTRTQFLNLDDGNYDWLGNLVTSKDIYPDGGSPGGYVTPNFASDNSINNIKAFVKRAIPDIVNSIGIQSILYFEVTTTDTNEFGFESNYSAGYYNYPTYPTGRNYEQTITGYDNNTKTKFRQWVKKKYQCQFQKNSNGQSSSLALLNSTWGRSYTDTTFSEIEPPIPNVNIYLQSFEFTAACFAIGNNSKWGLDWFEFRRYLLKNFLEKVFEEVATLPQSHQFTFIMDYGSVFDSQTGRIGSTNFPNHRVSNLVKGFKNNDSSGPIYTHNYSASCIRSFCKPRGLLNFNELFGAQSDEGEDPSVINTLSSINSQANIAKSWIDEGIDGYTWQSCFAAVDSAVFASMGYTNLLNKFNHSKAVINKLKTDGYWAKNKQNVTAIQSINLSVKQDILNINNGSPTKTLYNSLRPNGIIDVQIVDDVADNCNLSCLSPISESSKQSGYWDITSTWNCGVVPSISSHVKINQGHIVKINVGNVEAKDLTLFGLLDYLNFSKLKLGF